MDPAAADSEWTDSSKSDTDDEQEVPFSMRAMREAIARHQSPGGRRQRRWPTRTSNPTQNCRLILGNVLDLDFGTDRGTFLNPANVQLSHTAGVAAAVQGRWSEETRNNRADLLSQLPLRSGTVIAQKVITDPQVSTVLHVAYEAHDGTMNHHQQVQHLQTLIQKAVLMASGTIITPPFGDGVFGYDTLAATGALRNVVLLNPGRHFVVVALTEDKFQNLNDELGKPLAQVSIDQNNGTRSDVISVPTAPLIADITSHMPDTLPPIFRPPGGTRAAPGVEPVEPEFPDPPIQREGIVTEVGGVRMIFLAAPPDQAPSENMGALTVLRQVDIMTDPPEEAEIRRTFGSARYRIARSTVATSIGEPEPGEMVRLNTPGALREWYSAVQLVRIEQNTKMNDLSAAIRYSIADAADDNDPIVTIRLRTQRKTFLGLRQRELFAAVAVAYPWGTATNPITVRFLVDVEENEAFLESLMKQAYAGVPKGTSLSASTLPIPVTGEHALSEEEVGEREDGLRYSVPVTPERGRDRARAWPRTPRPSPPRGTPSGLQYDGSQLQNSTPQGPTRVHAMPSPISVGAPIIRAPSTVSFASPHDPIQYIRGENKKSPPIKYRTQNCKAPPCKPPIWSTYEGVAFCPLNTSQTYQYKENENKRPNIPWYEASREEREVISQAPSSSEVLGLPGITRTWKEAQLAIGYDYYKQGCDRRDRSVERYYGINALFNSIDPPQAQPTWSSNERTESRGAAIQPELGTSTFSRSQILGAGMSTVKLLGLLPPRTEGQSDAVYLKGCIDAGLPEELLQDPTMNLALSVNKGIRVPPGSTCFDLVKTHKRAPGEDELEEQLKILSKEVTEKKISLDQAMRTVIHKGASAVQQERLLNAIPGGTPLAAGWPCWNSTDKQQQIYIYDRRSSANKARAKQKELEQQYPSSQG